MCVGQLGSLLTPMGNGTSFIIPILWVKSSRLGVPLIIIVTIKSFSASSLATRVLSPKTRFHLQEICRHQHTACACAFSAGGPNCGSLSLCAPSHWGNETQNNTPHQPLVGKTQERSLPPSLCFSFPRCWFPLPGASACSPWQLLFFFRTSVSRTHSHTHTESNQPSLKEVLVGTLRCSAGC